MKNRRLGFRLAVAAAVVWTASGCDMGLQDELNKKKDERFKKAASELREIAESRLTKAGGLAATYPDKIDPDIKKRGKQIVDWRMALADAKHVDPAADPKAREAAVKVKELASKRFATSDEAVAEVDKLVAAYNIGDDFARALRDAARGSSGRQFEDEIMRAIEQYSPVRTYEVALNKLSDTYKGTPTEQAAIDAAAFAKASHEFWTHAKKNNYGKMRGTAAKYVKFLEGWLKSMEERVAKAQKEGDKEFVPRIFIEEAAFDLVFLHAAAVWRGRNPVPFWAIRFGVPSGSARLLGDYVTKLCRESDERERCKPVPHERRPDALRKPYLTWVKEKASEYMAKHQGKDAEIFNKVLTQLNKDLEVALEAVPDLTEDPVMPEMYTTRSPSTGFDLTMSAKKGVELTGLRMAPVKWDTWDGKKLPAGFKAKMTEKVTELTKEGAQAMVNPETVTVLADGTLEGDEFAKLVQAFPYDKVAKMDLVGRRRADESMKAAGVLLRRPRPGDDGKARTSLKYQLDGAEQETTCLFAGYGGDMSNRKVADKFMVFDDKAGKVKAGDIVRWTEENAGEENKDKIGRIKEMKTAATMDITDNAAIQAHADKLSGGVRVFLPTKWSYNDLMKTLTGLMTKCTDVELKVGPMLQKTIKITCGETKDRPFRFDLGLCQ